MSKEPRKRQNSSSRGAKRCGDLKRAVRNPFLTAANSGKKGFLPALSACAEIATLTLFARNDGFLNMPDKEKE
jgi:hypothetical protein